MSEHESNSSDEFADATLDSVVDDAVHALRANVAVRGEWRDALLRDVASLPRPERRSRLILLQHKFTIGPLAALAACVVAMAVGAGGAIAWGNAHRNRGDVSTTQAMTHASNTIAANRVGAGRTTIRFALVAPGAARVSVVGDFNGWNADATPMQPVRDGRTWLVDMPLSAGRHLYAFVVDGDLVADPSAPRVVDDDFGVQNSVVLVGESLP